MVMIKPKRRRYGQATEANLFHLGVVVGSRRNESERVGGGRKRSRDERPDRAGRVTARSRSALGLSRWRSIVFQFSYSDTGQARAALVGLRLGSAPANFHPNCLIHHRVRPTVCAPATCVGARARGRAWRAGATWRRV